jgi:hypothetical protein
MSRIVSALVVVTLGLAAPSVAGARDEPEPLPGIPEHLAVNAGPAEPCPDPCRRSGRADVAGDERPEIVTTSSGSTPSIVIRSARTHHVVETIHPFGTHYQGDGVHYAIGDVDADGNEEIVAAAGPGAAPQVRVFDGATGVRIGDFFAFEPGFTGGVNVAVGDVDADGREDIVVGAGPGGGPNVRVFDPAGAMHGDFFAFDPSYRGGVVVGVD